MKFLRWTEGEDMVFIARINLRDLYLSGLPASVLDAAKSPADHLNVLAAVFRSATPDTPAAPAPGGSAETSPVPKNL